MSRTPRKQSESSIYHVFARGVGRQQIFEDSEDNVYFLCLLRKMASLEECTLFAYCLMGNHFHLLVRMDLENLSEAMRQLEISYAQYFNEKYEREGTLFQGRFGSEPVNSDEQLLAAVRYIHCNPAKAGISPFDTFEWSSYREYAENTDMVDTSLVLEMLGGAGQLKRFHNQASDSTSFMEDNTGAGLPKRTRQTDEGVRAIIKAAIGQNNVSTLHELSRDERNAVLVSLKSSGATVRQVERLTGISRGIIGRAWAKEK